MHQTFYIDIDEEISSVIDRLNKSMSTDNYFVVPKRAIFLQSIVNLKLLKREADKVGKHVIMVTQDEIGTSMAQRCGIDVCSAVDGLGIEDNEVVIDEIDEVEDEYPESDDEVIKPIQKKEIRLSGVGSSDFYDANSAQHEIDLPELIIKKSAKKSIPVKLITAQNDRRNVPERKVLQPILNTPMRANELSTQRLRKPVGFEYEKKLDIEKERNLEKMYLPKKNTAIEPSNVNISGNENKIKKIFLGFIGLCALSFIGVAAYLFIPSAKLVIQPNILKNKIDLDLHGRQSIAQAEQSNIPLRVIDKEEKISITYEVKGGATLAGKKAHGNVVIYNEFDSSPQTLIATTRLETTDGKIFRLVKNTIVPGTLSVAGEIKPGAITTEVIADQTGADYNINASDFTIPGFKDSPKYAKFYAKSSEAFVGGSIDGETAGGAVSQSDIDSAKQRTEVALKDKLSQAIKDELLDGEMAIEQAEKVTVIKSSAAVKIGDMVSSFDYTASASIRVLVFSENDVRSVMAQTLKNEQQSGEIKKEIAKIEYGTVNADFDKNELDLKVYGDIVTTPVLNMGQIKSEILGKNDDQLAAILRKYPTIKSVNVEFSPTFMTRIPQYDRRVVIEIKNDQQ